jgi:membrane protein
MTKAAKAIGGALGPVRPDPRVWLPPMARKMPAAAQRPLAVALGAIRGLYRDGGPHWAAAIAYYGLLSIFPLLLSASSIAAFFVDRQAAVRLVGSVLGQYLPHGQSAVTSIVDEAIAARGAVTAISLLFLLLSGLRVFGMVAQALDMAFGGGRPPRFWRGLVVNLLMLLTAGLLFAAAFAADALIGLLRARLSALGAGVDWIIAPGYQAAASVLVGVALLLTYKFLPRRDVNWRSAFVGALAATLLMVAARPIFLTYLVSFAQLSLIYGSLASIIVVLIWAWVVAMLVLFGGELAAAVQAAYVDQVPIYAEIPVAEEPPHLQVPP